MHARILVVLAGRQDRHEQERAPVEESGRPHLPVKEEIAGSKPVGRADGVGS